MWQPVTIGSNQAQTLGAFYGMPIVGDFLGRTEGQTSVVQNQISGQSIYQGSVAYTSFNNGKPMNVIILNQNEWPTVNRDGSLITGTPRGTQNYTLSGLPAGCSLSMKLLTSVQGAHALASNITYGGSQWTYASGGKEQTVLHDTQSFKVGSNGKVAVSLQDSSAGMISLGC